MKFLLSLLGACAIVLAREARCAPAPDKPNFLFILADDLGWGDVGFNGRKEWKTPHLDRLARQGTVFRRWYTAAVVCAPSRAALMTGKYPIHCGVSLNDQDLPRAETTLPEALRPLGYRSALIGKWHHGRTRAGETNFVHPLDHGFDEFTGYADAHHAWQHFPTNLWFGRERRPVNGYSATLLTDYAIDFLRRQRGQPFFLYQAYIEPHLRIEAPGEDVQKFRGKFEEADPAKPLNATYAAMITRLDAEIGRLLRAVDDLGLARDTLVVFTSDHGATFEPLNLGTAAYHDSNRPFRGHKRTLWEGGIRVPGIVRWPGRVPAGRATDGIVHMTDVFPTLLAAAGGAPEPAWQVDGRNILPFWTGGAEAPARTLFWEWRAESYFQLAAMRGDHKLVVNDEDTLRRLTNAAPRPAGGTGRRSELFNVRTDPAERRTIYHSHERTAGTLEKELTAWLATESEASKERARPARN
jgi:arylsulfatase A-like enzyme